MTRLSRSIAPRTLFSASRLWGGTRSVTRLSCRMGRPPAVSSFSASAERTGYRAPNIAVERALNGEQRLLLLLLRHDHDLHLGVDFVTQVQVDLVKAADLDDAVELDHL